MIEINIKHSGSDGYMIMTDFNSDYILELKSTCNVKWIANNKGWAFNTKEIDKVLSVASKYFNAEKIRCMVVLGNSCITKKLTVSQAITVFSNIDNDIIMHTDFWDNI